jgi:RNA polymerase sigma-70 factor (ECF subfamily)
MPTTEQIWETFHGQIRQFILTYIHDEDLAEDILQDVFIKIYRHIDTLKDEKKLQTWLYQIVRHTIYDQYRCQKQVISLPTGFDLPEEPPEEDVEQALLSYVRLLVDRLPAPYREAITLTEYQGLTQKELAERLGISLPGAKSRVQRARKMLKSMLLDCCHFVLDRRGKIIEYHSRNECHGSCACCQ